METPGENVVAFGSKSSNMCAGTVVACSGVPVKALDCRHQECQSLAGARASFAQDVTASAMESSKAPRHGESKQNRRMGTVSSERAYSESSARKS